MARKKTAAAGGAATPMAKITDGLFELPNDDAAAARFYYLLTSAAEKKLGSASLTLQDSWTDYAGWYLYTMTDLSADEPGSFVTNARDKMGTQPETHGLNTGTEQGAGWILWTTGLADITTCSGIQWQQFGPGKIFAAPSLKFTAGRLGMSIDANQAGGPMLQLYDGGSGSPPFFCMKAVSFSAVQLTFDGEKQTGTTLNNEWYFRFPVTGPACGSAVFPLGMTANILSGRFDCAFAYLYSAASGVQGTPDKLLLPLFEAMGSDTGTAFEFSVNPFDATSAWATGFRPDTTGQLLLGADDTPTTDKTLKAMVQAAKGLTSPYFHARTGEILSLVPAVTASTLRSAWTLGGFGTSAVASGAGASAGSYFSPAGYFQIVSNAGASKGGAVVDTTEVSFMPGLFSEAFLQFESGCVLECVPNMPADATVPLAGREAGASPLGDSFRTSYASIAPAGALSSALLTSAVTPPQGTLADYYGQASASTFYLPNATSAISVNVPALVKQASASVVPPFPILPFGAAFSTAQPVGGGEAAPVNPNLTPADLEALERTAISTARNLALTASSDGPVVPGGTGVSKKLRTRVLRTETDETSVLFTPQGYQLALNADGSFAAITLAVGTGGMTDKTTYGNSLTFTGAQGAKSIDPAFAKLLTKDSLFLVMNTLPSSLGFANIVGVSGFNFRVDLSGTADASVLIFKFDPKRSLRDLALDPASWDQNQNFATNRQQILTQLQDAFDQAEGQNAGELDPFAAFNIIANDPAWTGVIAFGVPIDGNGMPPDFQMLLGGIDGGLIAHHIGVDTSKIGSGDGGGLEQTSLFGVIDYIGSDAEPPNPSDPLAPQYDVARLIAVIASSALVDLNVAVNLILPGILGRALTMTGGMTPNTPPNTIQIQGVYQRHGDVGRVTFSTTDPFSFEATLTSDETVRIIDQFLVHNASLVPVSGTGTSTKVDGPAVGVLSDGSGNTTVVADFVLNGEIGFNAAPFAIAPDLDLFSYGYKDSEGELTGLGFSGLTVKVSFKLDANGQMVTGSKKVALLENTLTPDATTAAIRPNSLLGSLPLQLTSFVVQSNNTPVGAGAQVVDIAQLHPVIDSSNSDASVSPPVTASPAYGLTFHVSLGTLGSLSSVHTGLTAALTVAWGPSATVPDNDAATVLMALPSLSAGYKGFDLQGLLKTRFGDANLVGVNVPASQGSGGQDRIVYALLFGNIQLSVFGYTFPPGLLVDFLLFAGNAANADSGVQNLGNIGWLLSATNQTGGNP